MAYVALTGNAAFLGWPTELLTIKQMTVLSAPSLPSTPDFNSSPSLCSLVILNVFASSSFSNIPRCISYMSLCKTYIPFTTYVIILQKLYLLPSLVWIAFSVRLMLLITWCRECLFTCVFPAKDWKLWGQGLCFTYNSISETCPVMPHCQLSYVLVECTSEGSVFIGSLKAWGMEQPESEYK